MTVLPGQTALPEPIAALAGVERLREGGREREGLVGLDRNERLAPLPEAVLAELRTAIDSQLLTRYPSNDEFYDELAAHLGIARERLLLTPGSDGAVRALHHAYVSPGTRTAMVAPSYAMYPIYGEMFGAQPVQVHVDERLAAAPAALLEAIGDDTRLVLLARPNQPTGTLLAEDVLEQVLARATAVRALVVVDEAYHPFSGTTVLPWVERHRNLVVLRTFSKAWGMAGLRLGVVCADPEVARTLYKVRSAYDVNAVAIAFARIVLAHPEIADDYVAQVDAGRALLGERLRRLGFEPLGGRTNFQVFRVAPVAEPAPLAAALEERGFLVKGPFGHPSLAACLRATLGPPELMDRFAGALEAALA